MSYVKIEYPDMEAWLLARHDAVTGSDSGAILGVNKYIDRGALLKAKVLPLKQKKADAAQEKLRSTLSYMEYGSKAEEPLRKLFELDYYGQYEVEYIGRHTVLQSIKRPHAIASVDGILIDKLAKDEKGILEIKTVNIFTDKAVQSWLNGGMPKSYYYQVLHYLEVTQFKYAILKAQFKSLDERGQIELRTFHYRIEKNALVTDDMAKMVEMEDAFYKEMMEGRNGSKETKSEDNNTNRNEEGRKDVHKVDEGRQDTGDNGSKDEVNKKDS
jgi:putative phage-type endonuclease